MRRTTVRIDEALLNEAKAFAARNGRTLNSVMEDALKQLLSRSDRAQERARTELITAGDPRDAGLVDWSPAATTEFLLEDDFDHFVEVERRAIVGRERAGQRPSQGR